MERLISPKQYGAVNLPSLGELKGENDVDDEEEEARALAGGFFEWWKKSKNVGGRVAVCLFAVVLMIGYWSIGFSASSGGVGDALSPAESLRVSILYNGAGGDSVTKKEIHDTQAIAGLQLQGYPPASVQLEYDRLVRKIAWDDVESDLESLLTSSQDWWPAGKRKERYLSLGSQFSRSDPTSQFSIRILIYLFSQITAPTLDCSSASAGILADRTEPAMVEGK